MNMASFLASNERSDALAGGLGYSSARAILMMTSRVLGIAFARPLKWFRPSHVGMQLGDVAPNGLRHHLRAVSSKRWGQTRFIVGNVLPVLAANSATGVIAFGVFDYFSSQQVTPGVAGAMAGLAVAPLTVTLEVAKFIANQASRQESRSLSPLRWIIANTRLQHFKACATPVLMRETISLAALFAIWNSETQSSQAFSPYAIVSAGVMASIAASIAAAPFDTLKWYRLEQQMHNGPFHWRWKYLLPTGLSPFKVVGRKLIPGSCGLIIYDLAKRHSHDLD